jgi:hypothetical protein
MFDHGSPEALTSNVQRVDEGAPVAPWPGTGGSRWR